ncbi:MAG TPA: inositol monophosphatase family protein [Vicinamibacterales bacterium]|nr:inositol monophosphatase family protein [Vicinamibacterales bacterium]
MVPDALPPLYLATAVEAVARAGAMQMAGFGHDLHIRKKGAIDLVTEIDLDVERMFRALVAERFPGHTVLAEEFASPGDRERAAEWCWVFDPVDGTTNFAHGLPIFCSSLALEHRGAPVVAAVYDPARRELFTAERGSGARLNGVPLHVSSAATLVDALLCTGFPYTVHEDLGDLVGVFGAFLGRSRAVRRLGSAALDLCYVAAGRLDGFWEQHLNPWDVAAGALIVEEAGGRVTNLQGGPFTSRDGQVIASNGVLHGLIVQTIAEYHGHLPKA